MGFARGNTQRHCSKILVIARSGLVALCPDTTKFGNRHVPACVIRFAT